MEGFSLQMPEFTLGPLKLTVAVPLGWIVTGVAIILMLVIRLMITHFHEIPSGIQNFIEWMVETAENAAKARIPKGQHVYVVPYILVLGIYIFLNALLELIGIEPAIFSLSATLSMGIFTFLWIHWYSFKIRGFKGKLQSYVKPVAFMAPFKLISDLFVPVSMGCRLFGNVLAGTIVMGLLYNSLVPLVYPAAAAVYFSIIHMLIQGYIFITLTLSFIEENTEEIE